MLDHDTDSYYKISRAFLGGPPSGNLTRTHILDNVTLYWLTGTGVSAARSYWENYEPAAAAAARPLRRSPPGRLQRLPRRDLPGTAQLGPERLPDPHVLQPARQGRALRRLGGAQLFAERASRGVPVTPLAVLPGEVGAGGFNVRRTSGSGVELPSTHADPGGPRASP